MRVKELIELLQRQDLEAVVYIGVMVGDEENSAARNEVRSGECLVAETRGPLDDDSIVAGMDQVGPFVQVNGWWTS